MLNHQYRDKNKPTNVLSFPFQNPPGLTLPLLGDLVVCKNIVECEAADQRQNVDPNTGHIC